MKARRLILWAAALAAVPLAIAPPAVVAQAPRDWTRTVTRTPAGAFVMGNPQARVKLVEYLSLTCSHCAHFAETGLPALKRDYIAKGMVSLEVRHAVRDGYDLSASLLARCDGGPRYFPTADAIFARQGDWLKRASEAAPPSGRPTPETIGNFTTAFASAAGLDALMRARGMPAARVQACLTNKAEIDRLSAMTDDAWKVRKLQGTPAFLINGKTAEGAFDWTALEPQLKAALR
ncbi:thioredoxin domain-containing protein [Sphingomonas sp. 1P06PA]|uniref:DsbA family protein n=1 Tax=Sphingomonas sp. 1P06PA TaxID=554121 RepID=UPI0039A4F9AA